MSIAERPAPGGLEGLIREERDLADVTYPISIREGERLGREGDTCDGLYLVRRGIVALYRHGDQDERMLTLVRAGDLLGEEALSTSPWRTTARALTDVEAFLLTRRVLPQVMRLYPAVNQCVVDALARRLDRTQRLLGVLGNHGAVERVQGLLRLITDPQDADSRGYAPVPPLTQHQIAEMLGLARETVARALADLERTGAIRRHGRLAWLRQHATLFSVVLVLLTRIAIQPPISFRIGMESPRPRARRGRVARTNAPIGFAFKLAGGEP
jgi:CRP/FNR family transcriptional regulator